MKRSWNGLVTLLFVALLQACGGGGGGGGGGETETPASAESPAPPPPTPVEDPLQQGVMLAVAFYDAFAGTDRLFSHADAHAQIAGPPGSARTVACSSGSITTQKVDATTFVLTANQCMLQAFDGLIYNGPWTFSFTRNDYAPDGLCTKPICVLFASVDNRQARFGYGVAEDPVVRGNFHLQDSDGKKTVWTEAAGTYTVDDESFVLVGNLAGGFSVSSGQVPLLTYRNAGLPRSGMMVDGPLIKGELIFTEAGTVAWLDTDRNGSRETERLVRWSTFRE